MLWLLPELKNVPPAERRNALRVARDCELDVLELLGVAFAFVLAALLARLLFGDVRWESRVLAFLMNFALAAPVILVAFLPFHLRRLRRGLRARRNDRGLVP
ncbi:MAG: hypothetical protein HY854_10670 [Burkholderiales bacterium]|nr:hypothetical protein [Burkholderiales bacterium]